MSGIVFNWTTSNETVGTINNAGFFTAIVAGTTTIKAINGTMNRTANVTVFASITTPTPTETPLVNNTTPSPTYTAHPHSTQTSSPSETAAATPTPAVTSTLTPSVPRFKTIFALVGLFAVAYVTKRRRNPAEDENLLGKDYNKIIKGGKNE
jgi:hypothetical protein